MPFDRAKTSLGFLEDKFRKVFGLAGAIGATFEPTITPVFITGTALDPGVASFRGRHWAWQYHTDAVAPSAANDTYGLTWPVDVIVRGISVTGLAAGDQCAVFIIAPDDPQIATWGGGNRQTGVWIDQGARAAERTPLLDRALRVSVGMAIANPELKGIAYVGAPTGGTAPFSYFPMSLHSPAGGCIWFQPSLSAASLRCRFAIWGEIA